MNSSDIIDDGEKCIQKLLWRLRHEDATQYNTLVKMHLSFATDLPTDQIAVHIRRCDMREQPSGRRWHLTPLIRRLGRSGNGKGVMEGAPLTQEGVCQAFQLIHYLNKDYNITQEGLFRKSGSLTRQQELKSLLNSGGDLNLDYGVYSAHDCASVLKSFLADLPEPLLTEAHYSIHCKIAEMHQSHMSQEQKEAAQSRQVKALRLLFLLLPSENYQLLQDLLILLNRVAAHKEQNLMSAINLGTMFAPHILCPRKMAPNDLQYLSGTLSTSVAFMIENQPQLFKVPLELEYDVRQYWNNKKRMKHQLSKRSMMDAPTNTIFTFIDRELTAQANDKDVTEVALAELYAYVQSLPDSAKKRRLIKQFNHASGSGTPQLNQSFLKRQEARGKRLGDSIKKVMMTPRSRCPIIINSTTSLSNVPIPEEKDSQNTPVADVLRTKENLIEDETSHNSPVITNPAAKLSSPVRPTKPLADSTNLSINTTDSEMNDPDYNKGKAITIRKKRDSEDSCENEGETKLKRWGSSTLRRTLSSASSTGSLFGSFFRHLSTSSLAQLASRLSSASSLINPEVQEEEKSDESECEEDGEMNESLSSVFKDYLLSRSILTDNPVDLSTDCLEKGIEEDDKVEIQEIPQTTDSNEENSDDNLGDSAYGESQPPSKSVSRQCSKASLGSADSALDLCSNKELSESLLYCLDGNNPLSSTTAVIDKSKEQLQTTREGVFTPDRDTSAEEQVERLHSCSPESRRQSILKTKQGTPVPQWDKVHTESGGSTRGVLFETSF
ncbi:uncharacterized protein LOC125034827 isoform X2 [Penaeus chinensis]|uniref:uncharacterized protein LOC125034827 isoform X2 n=1 Tax=Penaeus chinensis TaxID=139456 RepID=UPI001FB7BDE4|nr:uncharacterized protein LOC125034827 isoform X2 [Penaeus chinensis]